MRDSGRRRWVRVREHHCDCEEEAANERAKEEKKAWWRVVLSRRQIVLPASAVSLSCLHSDLIDPSIYLPFLSFFSFGKMGIVSAE